MITARNLTKMYGDYRAVAGVNFAVEAGETLVLLGTSGSGKTTLLRLLNRLLEPTAGEILFNGENIRNIMPATLRRNLGYVLQNHGLFPHYTVAENIAVVPRLLQWPTARIQHRVTELLEKLNLPPAQYQHAYPDQLSGGQKQRVGLARALAASPPVLLMDEPFGALDPITRTTIKKEFAELDELKAKTIILVTHEVQEAFELGNRIALMHQGQLVQLGTPADLLFRPASALVSAFFEPHQLQLELKTLTLQNIWDDLPETSIDPGCTLQASQSIWEALTILTSGTDRVGVQQPGMPTTKLFTPGQLVPLFNHFRKK